VYEAASRQGFCPDFHICADEVVRGRPAPWMIFRCMEALDVYPPKRVVKVGDTFIDIEDGINAGVWSVAVVDSSSEMGLSEAEFTALDPSDRDRRRSEVRAKFEAAGADGVLTHLGELPNFIRDLNRRLTDSL
jgi:phosphonoacetaldehyde hydrolase